MHYQPFYCEENVFHLAQEPTLAARPREVVFISNAERSCPVWHQKASVRPGWPILWDYHVVLLCAEPWEIWDLDTTLGFPVPAAEYLRRSFREGLAPELSPSFRLVEAGLFAATFCSDRAHMRTEDGDYRKPPPPWPAIGPAGATPNLMRFVDMTAGFHGSVVDLPGLVARIADA